MRSPRGGACCVSEISRLVLSLDSLHQRVQIT